MPSVALARELEAEIGVGDLRAREGDHVGDAVADDLLGLFDRRAQRRRRRPATSGFAALTAATSSRSHANGMGDDGKT